MSEIQTQLVKALKRDILLHRRRIQTNVSNQLLYDVKKHRIVDDHFDAKRSALIHAANASKHRLDARHEYYEGRGHLALDVIHSELFAKLDRLETRVVDDLEALKAQNNDILKELAELEHTMAVRQSACHFFKSLYEKDPARPVGETREMLQAAESSEPCASPWDHLSDPNDGDG